MYILSDILLDALEIMKETDEQNYEVYSTKLYKMAYGNNLTKELAEEIVSKMRPYGEKWTMVSSLYDMSQDSKTYVLTVGYENTFDILFGTGVYGKIPSSGSTIIINFLLQMC